MDYLLNLLVFVLIYAMLALSLNLTSGFTGLISLAQAGFYGVGAYTAAILAANYGWPFWINLPLGMLLSGLFALPVGLIALRTVGDYFIICTLGMGVILFSLMNNWTELTRGPLGIYGIPPVSFLGDAVTSKLAWVVLAGVFYGVMHWVVRNVAASPLGRILVALSEDEVFTESMGKNVGMAKLQSFVMGAMLAAVPGALYAHYVSYIDPTSFRIEESIFILSIVIIGGMGKLWGSLAAAAFMIFAPEALRFLGLPDSVAANVRQILYGIVLVVLMLRRAKKLPFKSLPCSTAT